ncbi:SH3 domain-containing protein C23A1.17-like isoform X2 [Astyanax mexicanus]|uniref:SH3 domain-containing protein C23A1.17-like isoform X2 n=1 Tax=Astyanax mexicanus TaxID=7994 RepID=A0A8T2LBI9_ASTMX|nr:SH3 domain-containing protein C23A1.17-like isoform X2 [Astyanax mexicanus]
MMVQFAVLLLCVLGLSAGFPLAPPPSPAAPGNTLLIPVTIMSSYGPQVVLIPVNTAQWNMQRNTIPTPPSAQTYTLTQPQHQVKNENAAQAENVNSPFLQPDTPTDPALDTHTLPLPPEAALPQGQVNDIFIADSNSESSEEGDANQVIYLLPVSAEIPNMGIAEGGQGGLDINADPNANPDPNLGYLQNPTPSPTPLAGLQETPAPLGKAPPTVSATERPSAGVQQNSARGSAGGRAGAGGDVPEGTANPCPQKGKRSSLRAKGPSL